jgi:phosphopantothenoylcysteine decarboxylase/phosphopantothenate--cysteine ligase
MVSDGFKTSANRDTEEAETTFFMNTGIENKNIILGVTGGIAAYKSLELLRLLKKGGAHVRVIMTQNATRFVGPLSFEALSGQPVCTSLFEKSDDATIRHIEWAESTDAVIVAPATANMVGKLAHGLADDALSTFMMAVTCPVMICPSMNTNMYMSRAVQQNLSILNDYGYLLVEPDSGSLACGTVGPGRLPEPEQIYERVLHCLTQKDFKGKRFLITAGPTQEFIDPVRYLSNPSSGKMGYAVAKAAAQRGGEVVLVTGPTVLPDPYGVTLTKVRTAEEMAKAVFEQMQTADIIIKAAAVSDYYPVEQSSQKIKKHQNEIGLSLKRTPDILKALGERKTDQFLVGFAAETEDLQQNAETKLKQKNLDLIVGNLVGIDASGFRSDTNTVTIFYPDRSGEPLPSMEKENVAHVLLDRIRDRIEN